MKTNGIFEMRVKNAEGKEAVWTIDLKQTGTVYKGEPKSKPNVTIILSDETFTQLAEGKLDGQKAFMSGKLKTKGNMMFATKLMTVLKVRCGTARPVRSLAHARIPGNQDPGEAVKPYFALHTCHTYPNRIVVLFTCISRNIYPLYGKGIACMRSRRM